MQTEPRILEQTTVYQSRKFLVERRLYASQAGVPQQREVVVHPGAVVILPFLDDHTIVLIRNTRIAVGETLLELPAGTLEPDEPPIQTAARELIEETGYTADTISPMTEFYPSPGILTEKMYAFTARGLTHVGQQLEPSEAITVHPTPIADVFTMLKDGVFRDGKTIALLGLYFCQTLRGVDIHRP